MQLDFIIIGAHKTGTSWLHKCLETHPQICMPRALSKDKKIEPEYFNDTVMPWRTELQNNNYSKGINWYATFFGHCESDKIYGESSPIYLHSPEVPQRIHEVFPDIKLIAILRNPLERLVSYYNYLHLNEDSRTRIPDSFSDFIRMRGVMDLNLYSKHLNNYLNLFPKSRIKILFHEDIVERPKYIINDVYKFLCVDTSYTPPSLETKINSVQSRVTESRYHSNKKRFGRYFGKLITILEQKLDLAKQDTLTTSMVSDTDRSFIHTFLSQDLEALEKLTGRNLTQWRNSASSSQN